MDVLSIVRKYLEENGFAGLANDTCGCSKDDLAPCGDGMALNCRPAVARVLGADEWVGDCGPGDTCYFATWGPTTRRKA